MRNHCITVCCLQFFSCLLVSYIYVNCAFFLWLFWALFLGSLLLLLCLSLLRFALLFCTICCYVFKKMKWVSSNFVVFGCITFREPLNTVYHYSMKRTKKTLFFEIMACFDLTDSSGSCVFSESQPRVHLFKVSLSQGNVKYLIF